MELCFSLPFSNGRVEQIFSSLKVVKTNRRTRLAPETLNDLLEIFVEGPPLQAFSPDLAIEPGGKTQLLLDTQINLLRESSMLLQ